MDEGDSQPIVKTETVEQQEQIGDTPNVTQEKSASSGSEGSDGFVKYDLEDAQPASSEVVEDISPQPNEQTLEEFSKLTPSTDVLKSSIENEETPEETTKSQKSDETEQKQEEDVTVGDRVDVDEISPSLNNVEDEDKSTSPEKEDSVEPCKLYTVLPTSVKRVMDILYWRDIKASMITFVFTMFTLLTLSQYSILVVFFYMTFALLFVTMSIKIYNFIEQTYRGIQQPNPFKNIMELDITVSNEKAHEYFEIFLNNFNNAVVSARNIIFYNNMGKSLKFALASWIVGQIGHIFNGLTLLTIAVVLAFTIPILYEKNQDVVDRYLEMAKKRFCSLYNGKVRAVLSGGKPKSE